MRIALGLLAALGAATMAGIRPWSAPSAAPIMVTRTVQSGDTLWSLARRYGDPHKNVLERIDQLSRANRMVDTPVLVPGQRLVIPVENPAEVALIQRTVASEGQSRY